MRGDEPSTSYRWAWKLYSACALVGFLSIIIGIVYALYELYKYMTL